MKNKNTLIRLSAIVLLLIVICMALIDSAYAQEAEGAPVCEPVEVVQGSAIINGQLDILYNSNGDPYPEWETNDIGGRHFSGYLYRAGRPDLHPSGIYEVYTQWNPALSLLNILIWEPTGTFAMDDFDDDDFFVKVAGDKRDFIESVSGTYLWEFSIEWNLTDFGQKTQIHLTFDDGETASNVFCFAEPTAINLIGLGVNEDKKSEPTAYVIGLVVSILLFSAALFVRDARRAEHEKPGQELG